MDFLVNRSDLSDCRFVEPEPAPLEDGQVRLRVSKFAFTANNVTYAVAGDMLSYWKFFPAEDGWGRVPVWGIGVVEESRHSGVTLGDRYFGYYPMSTHLAVKPEKVGPHGFTDATPHRSGLPATYNSYSLMTPELGFSPEQDDYVMVLRVLFMTGYLLDGFLATNEFFAADTVIISSASSKTAIALAWCLQARPEAERPRVIGLTSRQNLAFVESLGYYNVVKTYEDIAQLSPDEPAVFVDMAGNAEVIAAVHNHFEDDLTYSCMVGITHWQNGGRPDDLPGPEPQMFFAPDQIQRLNKELGPAGMQKRMSAAWNRFVEAVRGVIAIEHAEGPDAVRQVYLDTLQGKADPKKGYVLAL